MRRRFHGLKVVGAHTKRVCGRSRSGVINGVRQQKIKLFNGRKKYRGLKTHYRVSKSIGKGSIFICSRDVRRHKEKVSKFGEMLSVKDLSKLMLQEILDFTLFTHNQIISPKIHSISTNQVKNSS